MITGSKKIVWAPVIVLAGFALLTTGAEAQVARKADEKTVTALVNRTFPKWDESVLKVEDGKNWTATLNFRTVLAAAGDKTQLEKEPPADAKRLQAGNSVVRIDRQRGKVRYINRDRDWSYDKRDAKVPDDARAKDVFAGALKQMDFPTEEIADIRIATQVAAGAAAGDRKTKDEFPMYRFVTATRKIKDLPVYDSKVYAAVGAQSEIQRLQIIWPTFQLTRNLKLRSRDDVVREAVAQILEQDPRPDIKINAKLAYAPAAHDDEEVRYVPAVIASVYSGPTPYQLVIPVADTGMGKR